MKKIEFKPYPNSRGNILIGQQSTNIKKPIAKNTTYVSLYNGNKNPEEVELDVSGILSNTSAVKGTIIMFYDITGKGAHPTGWEICDGNNGTPDLTGVFIRASDKKDFTPKGTNDTKITDFPHSHMVTFAKSSNHTHVMSKATVNSINTNGNHTHTETVDDEKTNIGTQRCPATNAMGGNKDWLSFHTASSTKVDSSKDGAHTHVLTAPVLTLKEHSHTHKVTISTEGTDDTNKDLNMPPYYSLVYIQKT